MKFWSIPGGPQEHTYLRKPFRAKGVDILDTERHLTSHPTDVKLN